MTRLIWGTLASIAAGILLTWVVLISLLCRAKCRYEPLTLLGVLRILPDVLRLLRRLALDPSQSLVVRVGLWLLLAYLISPLDLIPDVIPVIGYADDALIVALALRSIIRRSGPQVIEHHWSGSSAGLAMVLRLAGSEDAR